MKKLVSTSPTRCREPFGTLSIGLITSAIKKEILSTTLVRNGLDAVYGFGSFFRGDAFNDIDLLAVASEASVNNLATYYDFRSSLARLSSDIGTPFHLTLLTVEEFLSRPLRDMSEIQLLWGAAASMSAQDGLVLG